jgi:hypothetical protein
MATATTRKDDLTVTRTATIRDAQLLVEIFNGPLAVRAQDGLHALYNYPGAPTWERFNRDHPQGTPIARDVTALLNLNEMIGTFVKRGLLDRDLVNDLLWVEGTWRLCKNIALHYRDEAGEPEIYANFERLATGGS